MHVNDADETMKLRAALAIDYFTSDMPVCLQASAMLFPPVICVFFSLTDTKVVRSSNVWVGSLGHENGTPSTTLSNSRARVGSSVKEGTTRYLSLVGLTHVLPTIEHFMIMYSIIACVRMGAGGYLFNVYFL